MEPKHPGITPETAEQVAQISYEPSYDRSTNVAEQGLAVTHEQVNDDYTEGTNDAHIDAYAGEQNLEIPRTGYENMFRDAEAGRQSPHR